MNSEIDAEIAERLLREFTERGMFEIEHVLPAVFAYNAKLMKYEYTILLKKKSNE